MDMTAKEIISIVSKEGPRACVVLARLLESGESYPGPIEDIKTMANDFSSLAFAYPVASMAWAYLEMRDIDRYDGDNHFVADVVATAIDGSLFERAKA